MLHRAQYQRTCGERPQAHQLEGLAAVVPSRVASPFRTAPKPGPENLATILSGMNALVIRPLPGVTEAAELVTFDRTPVDGTGRQQASYRYYEHVRSRAHALDGVGAWSKVSLTISSGVGGTSASGTWSAGTSSRSSVYAAHSAGFSRHTRTAHR